MTKISRNGPCPCGKKRPNGLPIKYKNCCLNKDILKQKLITKLRNIFIGEPYTQCPNCKHYSFGVVVSAGGGDSFKKECTECKHSAIFKLPKIKKQVIYLDQFIYDNIVKNLDKSHPKNEAAKKEPFWIEVFKKLEIVTRSQLVVCPDSFFHQEESQASNYFSLMKRIYEHFSGGATFFPYDQIVNQQICEHFGNYLAGLPENEPSIEPEKIVLGRLNEWKGQMQISINFKTRPEELKSAKKTKEVLYQSFLQVFERWKTEKNKKFEDWYKEENGGFARGTVLVIKKYCDKRARLPEKILRGEQLDLDDVLPSSSLELIKSMHFVARKHGLEDEKEIYEKIGLYLFSDNLDHIPAIRIGSLLYAAIADQAAKGRLRPPSKGVMVDVNMISSLMPYCQAIFVDKENAVLLNDNSVKNKLRCKTKIFSLRNKEDFLKFLDQIIADAPEKHIKHLINYYGEDWQEPYMEILEHEKFT